jgi:hypothetical protein
MFARKNRRVGKLSFKSGETVGLQITPESGVSSCFEPVAIPPLLDEFVKQGATFNVYRSTVFSMPAKGTDSVAAKVNKEATGIKKHKLEPFEELNVKEEDIFEVKLEEEPVPPKRPDIVEKQKVENGAGNGRNEFLTALQRIFLKMEKFLDSFSDKGGFQRAFKRACVEKSETYHFLDPFEGKFDYQGKKIRLDADVGTEEFIMAIAESFDLTLSYIKKDLPKNVFLPPGLKGDIESTFKNYQGNVKLSDL